MQTTRKQRRKLLTHAKTFLQRDHTVTMQPGPMMNNYLALRRGAQQLIDCNATDTEAVRIYTLQLQALNEILQQLERA